MSLVPLPAFCKPSCTGLSSLTGMKHWAFLWMSCSLLTVFALEIGSDDGRASDVEQRAAPAPPIADFRDLAATAGLNARTVIGGERTKDFILETTGGGAAVVDYDDDGWPDIFLVNGARLSASSTEHAPSSHLYRNNGDGTFTDVTSRAGVGGSGWGQGVCAGDYDNDGHVNLFVTYLGRQVLYHNNGDGTFSDATSASGLSLPGPRWNTGAAFLDFDRDGHLDLFVSAYVAYEDATRYPRGSGKDCFWKGLGVMCGPQGLAGSQNMLFKGNGDGDLQQRLGEGGAPQAATSVRIHAPRARLRQRSLAGYLRRQRFRGFAAVPQQRRRDVQGSGAPGRRRSHSRRPGAGRHGAVRRRLRPGRLAGPPQDQLRRRHAVALSELGGGTFEDATRAGGLGANTRFLGWGTGFVDFDLDSWPDIFIVNGHVYPEADRVGGRYSYEQGKLLYRNLGNGRFEDVSDRAGPGILEKRAARGAAAADLFNTGRQDIVVNNMHSTPTLLHNCAQVSGHSLLLQLVGSRSNRSAIGARVTVHLGTRRLIDEVRSGGSFCSQNDLRIHVGLGERARVDRVEVAWPGSNTEVIDGVDADQLVVIREGSGVVQRRPFVRRPMAACETR